jgi:hypothetical protein
MYYRSSREFFLRVTTPQSSELVLDDHSATAYYRVIMQYEQTNDCLLDKGPVTNLCKKHVQHVPFV